MMKKGIAESALALLILAVVTAVVLGMFVYNYREAQDCREKVELCHLSMELLSLFKEKGGSASGVLPFEPKIDCPMCVPGSSNDIKGISEEQTMQEIADHLRWCWYKTLGKENKIGRNQALIFLFEKKICTVCSQFKTDKEISSKRFLEYIKRTKIVNSPGKGKTYETYLESLWGTKKILDYYFLLENPALAGFIPENARLKEELSKKRSEPPIFKNTKYQVIHYNWAFSVTTPFNQLFLIPNDEIEGLPCDIYHYQEE